VIYPGSQGDPWWNLEQLPVQVKQAITIFEKAHQGCQALFIFDNLSAHASFGLDTLNTFNMNKLNGNKQCFQKDTVIPNSESVLGRHMRGKPQKMTMADGKAKGLQQVLEERSFDVKKKRAKCKPMCPSRTQSAAWLVS
jgi:hypothetical protein